MINDDHYDHPRDNDVPGFLRSQMKKKNKRKRRDWEARVITFAFLQFDVYLHVNISLHLSSRKEGKRKKILAVRFTTEGEKGGHLSVITPWTQ